jgi:chromosomal replication initiator protein
MTSSIKEQSAAEGLESPARAACEAVLERARRELAAAAFNMWFADLVPGGVRDDVLELVAPNAYVKNRLVAHHMDLMTGAAREVLGSRIRVKVKIERTRRGTDQQTAEGAGASSARARSSRGPRRDQPSLDAVLGASPFPDRYTFDTFVAGPSNKFAHAAALAVAETPPSKAYNPVFIYGGVGLGKTHLLFAIANHMWRLSPHTQIRYATSESFMTEFIKAVREGKGYLFQRQYRDVGVLLLDDVQFLARAEETQTEFFHTFNHLHQHERQIVIASDRPPQELGGIEERLRSRFRSGLVVDVQPPDLETRIAILQLKVLRDRLAVTDDVLHFIASKFENNIRELEGALLRVAAFGSLSRQTVDLALAERALEDLIPESAQEIPAVLIMEETSTYFGLEPEDLVSKSRSRPLTTARHVAMYLLRELTGLSLVKIGEHFGRDHTTVLHGIKKIEGLMPARGSTYRQVQDLTKRIRARVRGGS